MDESTLEISWQQMRPGVTVIRADGLVGQAAVVDRTAGTVVVLYSDGRREHHSPDERARVVVRGG